MKLKKPSSLFLGSIVALMLPVHICRADVNIDVDPAAGRVPISPLVYGTNQDIPGVACMARRYGGNRTTGYNWETNASNAGSDYNHQSDNYLTWVVGIPDNQASTPGIALTHFLDQSVAAGTQYSVITLPMAGYVAADKAGPVAVAQQAPSSRWLELRNTKPTAFSTTPDLTDGVVYVDEEIQFLLQRYGSAATATGVRGYNLDNEPDLWSSTHPRIHPAQPTCAELITRSVDLAKTVKRVDPAAETLGFVSYGFTGYLSFQNATDWNTERTKGPYNWFVDYYLDQMKKASDTAGRRLLDVLDLHNYSEALGGGVRINKTTDYTNIDCNKARIQAPRTFWDPTYIENSWIGQWQAAHLPLVPKVQESIAAFYPGTKLALTEYDFGGGGHISGGIAQADILGIFGKGRVYLACFWPEETDLTYIASGFNLYLNYDGSGAKFGDTSVSALASDVATCSAYAAIEGSSADRLHAIVLNKSYDTATTVNFRIAGPTSYVKARVFAFDSGSATITERTAVNSIADNQFSYILPPLTAAHFVLESAPPPPQITKSPVAVTVRVGTSASFSIEAFGPGALAYQWQASADGVAWANLADGNGYLGSTTGTLSIASAGRSLDGYRFRCAVGNGSGATVASAPAPLTVLGVNSPDFNRDGKADILWANPATGAHVLWLMNGTSYGGWADLGFIPVEWRIAANADFNADGNSDIVWENTTTGARVIWLMNGTTCASATTIGWIPIEWRIAGAGDFNGDGSPDILWENRDTGARVMWFMSGTAYAGWADLGFISTEWRVVGTGDFNADGKSDLVWENTVTGVRVIWLMNGATCTASAELGFVSTDWHIVGTGDFNADGHPDLLWENPSTGAHVIWYMIGTAYAGWSDLGFVSTDWHIRN